jgi:hypothetical protein
MNAIAASGGRVVFIPKSANSYFYESFECIPAATEGYASVQFTVEGPAGGSFVLEAQTTSSCAADRSTYKSSWYYVDGLTGQRQTITLPLSGFSDNPNTNALVGLVWGSFSQAGVQWSVGNITLVCSNPAQTTGERPWSCSWRPGPLED